MLRGYVRPSATVSSARQQAALAKVKGLKDSGTYVEERGKKGDKMPMRQALLGSLRKGHSDVVVVTDLHRLAVNRHDLAPTVRAIHERGASIVETSTGRKSSDPADMCEMVLDAVAFWTGEARIGSSAEAKRRGKMGGRPAIDRMSKHEALTIWRNVTKYPDPKDALALMTGWTKPEAYRHLKARGGGMMAGRKPKNFTPSK